MLKIRDDPPFININSFLFLFGGDSQIVCEGSVGAGGGGVDNGNVGGGGVDSGSVGGGCL